MKKILSFLIITFFGLQMFGQDDKLNQLFDQYQDTEGVTSIKIAKPMFRLLSNLNIDDEELNKIKPLINKVNSLKILVVDKPEKGNKDSLQAFQNFKKVQTSMLTALRNLNYEELMTVNSKDNKIKFLAANTNSNVLDNLLLTINGEDSNVLMMLDGKISIDDVSNLVNDVQEKVQKFENTENNSLVVRNVSAFHGVNVSSGIVVNFTQNSQRKIEIDADADNIKYVKTTVENGILLISIDRDFLKNTRFKKISVNIQNPYLDELYVSSGSIFNTKNNVTGEKLNAEISSGSIANVYLGYNSINLDASSGSILNMNVGAKSLVINANSGMMANITGNAENTSFKLDSGSSCNAQNLLSKNVKIDISSGAIAKVNASETLDVIASSGAIIQYKGNPEVTTNVKKSSNAVLKKID